ncbi:protease Do [Desulfurobacterium thermolithotrophum DSM 11699]|uniref:Protease Do n=1 Tax=Desulfurobacterium thermolithotrophum (strain DSM 11699 / BSA) TaxID=868864 RepID=F0S2X3_DESTD|nr:DegQ family serine endoprotease [Desulfurobacterium thermolithotrophum]ADY73195.1 protease Do [Desulfurobacterium thermolithotrophum DSM 11699]
MNTRQLLKGVTLSLTATFLFSLPSFGQEVKPTPQDYNVVESLEKVFESVAEKVKPAVVNISTVSEVKFKHPPIPPEFRDFFFHFGIPFPFDNMPDEFKTKSLGSGFIVKVKNGWAYILTNNHVIDKATKIKVKLSDGSIYKAKVVGKDPKTDIALIKIKIGNKKVPTVELGDSDNIKVGEFVIAVGNPYGLNWTVTHGIVSAKGRHGLGLNPIENFIQTDAAINPGNSGGPLCDIHGKVIGINTAIVRNAQGLGFAVPINIAQKVMNDLLKYGKVIRGWLGVYIEDLSPEIAKKFGVKKGVLVTKVVKDSPAEKGGLRSGDIIVEFNGKPVKNVSDLQLKVINTKPGEKVKVKIIRDGQKKVLTIKIGEMPGSKQVAMENLLSKYGFSVQKLTPELKKRIGIPKWIKDGLIVTTVKPGSPADDAGLKEGDVIVKAGTTPRSMEIMRSVDDLLSIIKKANGSGVLLKVVRGENVIFLVLTSEE